jgi:hypothetical protein
MENLNTVEIEQFKGQGTAIEQQAMALQVVDEGSRAAAADIRERARQFIKSVKEKFAPAKEKAHQAHVEICALEKGIIDPADRIVKILDKKSSDYLLEEDRKRREAQAKIDAENKRREDAERERLLTLAVKQAENGKAEKAEETLQKAEEVFMPAPILPGLDKSVKPESGGTSSTKDFDVVVDNPLLVIQEIAAGRLPVSAVKILENVLKNWAKMNRVGDKLPQIKGCRLTEKFSFSGRAK